MEYYAHVMVAVTGTGLADALQDYVLQQTVALGATTEDGDPIEVWADMPPVMRAQVESVKDQPRAMALAIAPVIYPDWGGVEESLPMVHATLRLQCPDGLIPWSDNPGDPSFSEWPWLSEVMAEFVDSEHRPDDDGVR